MDLSKDKSEVNLPSGTSEVQEMIKKLNEAGFKADQTEDGKTWIVLVDVNYINEFAQLTRANVSALNQAFYELEQEYNDEHD